MKIKSKFINKVGGFLIAWVVRLWMGTLDYKAALYDPAVEYLEEANMEWHKTLNERGRQKAFLRNTLTVMLGIQTALNGIQLAATDPLELARVGRNWRAAGKLDTES